MIFKPKKIREMMVWAAIVVGLGLSIALFAHMAWGQAKLKVNAHGYSCRWIEADKCPPDLDCVEVTAGVCLCAYRGRLPARLAEFPSLGDSRAEVKKTAVWKAKKNRPGKDSKGRDVIMSIPVDNAGFMGNVCP